MSTLPPPLRIRDAEDPDAHALGVLLFDSLPHNPSARLDTADLPPDAMVAGQDVVDVSLIRGEILLVAELAGRVAGLAHLRPKELVRSKHVATLTLYVHPNVSFERLAPELLNHALARAADRGLRKVTVDVTQGDHPLESLIATGEKWRQERHRNGALRLGNESRDVTTWARDL